MHIVSLLVGVHEHLLPREVGEDAQLDLGVVGADQVPTLLGQKGFANPAGKHRANRDVLQVWVAAGEPAGGGDSLVEIGVHPPRFRFHQGG